MSNIRDFCPLWGEWYTNESSRMGKGLFGRVYRAIKKDNYGVYESAVKHIQIPLEDVSYKGIINEEIIEHLLSFGVTTVELGAQSTDAEVLKIAGANLINNKTEWISFGEPGAGFWLMGLTEYESSLQIKKNPLNRLELPKDSKLEPKVLLTHHPHFFDSYLENEEKRPDLILTGHTHGGQAILPIIGGLFAPGQGFNPFYDFGIFTNEKYPNSRLIVTRGVGNSSFPFRINNRPEIVLITLN